jgi:hypothetical protein
VLDLEKLGAGIVSDLDEVREFEKLELIVIDLVWVVLLDNVFVGVFVGVDCLDWELDGVVERERLTVGLVNTLLGHAVGVLDELTERVELGVEVLETLGVLEELGERDSLELIELVRVGDSDLVGD